MSRSDKGTDGTTGSKNTQFAFVTSQNQDGVRSHAMREYWKQRQRRLSEKKSDHGAASSYLPIRPRLARTTPSPGHGDSVDPNVSSSQSSSTSTNISRSQLPKHKRKSPKNKHHLIAFNSVRSQALSGMNRALGSSQLDPFDRFPIKLTAQHHRLLHHWLSTYATMMFDDLARNFNPMRDVWVPLDLSNAASFNAIMAHSAAHLSRMRGYRSSTEALKFKAEAMRIVSIWMKDERLALSDDIFAAVLRLLTYERYWGTEAEWRIHRDGLQRMIDARGGITALQSNWRLGLVASLISLMAKPSWFDSSNQIQDILNPSVSVLDRIPSDETSLHRIRCLWLLSFVQDIGNFMSSSSNNLNYFTNNSSTRQAVSLIKTDMQLHESAELSRPEECQEREYKRLACLFFISVFLQASMQDYAGSLDASAESNTAETVDSGDITSLEKHLYENRDVWRNTIEGLFGLLFHSFAVESSRASKIDYALNMANVLGSMSSEARHGVERTLLRLLSRSSSDSRETYEGEWTPDTLLSTIHGV